MVIMCELFAYLRKETLKKKIPLNSWSDTKHQLGHPKSNIWGCDLYWTALRMSDSAVVIVLSEVKLHVKKEHKWGLSSLQLMSAHVPVHSKFLITCRTGRMTNLIVLFVHCQLRLSYINRWINEFHCLWENDSCY